MALPSLALDGAISDLSQKWGNGALRWGSGGLVGPVVRPIGAVADAFGAPAELVESAESEIESVGAPVESEVESEVGSEIGSVLGSVVPTGFAALDAILGPGGLPRAMTATLKGDVSSGKTTLALRLCAEAQSRGAVVAYLDPAGTLDPVEAVARGVDLSWLVVLAPEHLDEGLAMAAALLQARAVDLLVVDLCGAPLSRRSDDRRSDDRRSDDRRSDDRRSDDRGGGRKRAEAIRRLTALARLSGALVVVLEPANLHEGSGGALHGALVESSGLRLELARSAWIRLGREVVGQRVEVLVAKNRYGPPGRQVQLEILYADGTDRDGCLARRELLHPNAPFQEGFRDASPPSRLATSPAPPGAGHLKLVPIRAGHPRRPAVGPGDRARREPRGARLRGPTRVAARRSA
jgi:RecA/RadA recombinase